MTKIMTDEIKEATIGDFIEAKDLLNLPVRLKVVGSELKKDEITAKESGKKMDKIIFFFEDNKGNPKEIGVLSFDSLVRQMTAVDPDIGDILQLETINVTSEKYLVWKVELIKRGDGKVPAKPIPEEENIPEDTTGPVKKDDDSEEEITLDDVPF